MNAIAEMKRLAAELTPRQMDELEAELLKVTAGTTNPRDALVGLATLHERRGRARRR